MIQEKIRLTDPYGDLLWREREEDHEAYREKFGPLFRRVRRKSFMDGRAVYDRDIKSEANFERFRLWHTGPQKMVHLLRFQTVRQPIGSPNPCFSVFKSK